MNTRQEIRTGDRVRFNDRRAPDYRNVENLKRVPYQPRHSILRPLFPFLVALSLIGAGVYVGLGGAL